MTLDARELLVMRAKAVTLFAERSKGFGVEHQELLMVPPDLIAGISGRHAHMDLSAEGRLVQRILRCAQTRKQCLWGLNAHFKNLCLWTLLVSQRGHACTSVHGSGCSLPLSRFWDRPLDDIVLEQSALSGAA